MKFKSTLLPIIVISLLSSCSTLNELTYDDDVYSTSDTKFLVAMADDDDYFDDDDDVDGDYDCTHDYDAYYVNILFCFKISGTICCLSGQKNKKTVSVTSRSNMDTHQMSR